MPRTKREMRDPVSSELDDHFYRSDSYHEKQSDRDWDRRLSCDRSSRPRSNYPMDKEDGRHSKHHKPDYKRYEGVDKRQGRDLEERRVYYDRSPHSRDRESRDIGSMRESSRGRGDHLTDKEDDRQYSRHHKTDYKRYEGVDKRQRRDLEDRRVYYDRSPHSKDRDSRDIGSVRDSSRGRGDYLMDEDDDRQNSRHPKTDYKRYGGRDRRQGQDLEDRQVYCDISSRSRDHYSHDIGSVKDSLRDRRDLRELSRSSSRESSRRRHYSDSASIREQMDSSEARDRTKSSSRGVKSISGRERRDSELHEKDYDSDDEYHSPEGLNNFDNYHGMRGSVFVSGDSTYLDGEGYKTQAPNDTVIVRGLAQHITENDIWQDILQCGLVPKDIRLVRKRDTGASRGFAFVKFDTLQEASQWMQMKKGTLMLQDQYRAVMEYSIRKNPSFDRILQDWYCLLCGTQNFSRRRICFTCHASRQVSEEQDEGSGEVSAHPTNTVLLRNLDVLSTKDSVLQALKQQKFSSLPIRSIRIGQDALTNTSRGICYIELNNVFDSVYLHDALVADSLVVDGRKTLVSYCKLPQVLYSSKSRSHSVTENTWAAHSDVNHQYGAEDIPGLAEYCASLYATSPQEHAAYVQYYTQYYENQVALGGAITLPSQTQTDSVHAAAALAEAAIQQVQAAKGIKKQVDDPQLPNSEDKTSYVNKMARLKGHAAAAASTYHLNSPNTVPSSSTTTVPFIVVPAHSGVALQKHRVPDVSTYQYDQTSGYYYDAQTGLYYDAASQYYYNPQTQQFLYWEAEKQTYMPAPAGGMNDDPNSQKDEGKVKDKQDKVKVAKRVAKDMERWAKTLNEKKDNARQNETASASVLVGKSIGAADAGYAVLERKAYQPQDVSLVLVRDEEKQTLPTPLSNAVAPGLVAAYDGGSESDEEIEDVLHEDKQHTNWVKLACLLCKRQFPSKESLIRHQQFSALHKQNLENWFIVRGLDPHDPQQRNNNYRDRAKERRLKFGVPNPPHSNGLKEEYLKVKAEADSTSYEEPTKSGIGSENVGNKLLQKMGWQEGMGLGKWNQGCTSTIQAEYRNSTAGLGSKPTIYGGSTGKTYKDCVKKMMFARFQELTEQDQS